jgi:3-methyladenine DNA glycosylase/8-oxoguanine DNA glycosylase
VTTAPPAPTPPAPALPVPRDPAPPGTGADPDFTDCWRPGWGFDLKAVLRPHQRSAGDPAMQWDGDAVWRTTTTPCGPATVRITSRCGEVRVQAWGPGAEWAGTAVPGWLGADDDPEGFEPGHHRLVGAIARRTPDLRLGRTGRTWDALVPAVLEQKVTVAEAHRVWRALLRLAGDPAPGPAPEGMRVLPSPRRLREVTDWEWHRCGLDGARRRALLHVASVAHALEPDGDCDSPTLQRKLRTVPGIGVWTAAEVVQRTFGCPDTVSYGDYHLKNLVGWSLAGRRTDDDGMMELLEPWRGHRQRVVRLLHLGGSMPPRRGPRTAPTDHRRR